jgi:hypothetical protein
MKYLKYFENKDTFNVDEEDIKEIFGDFIDEFRIRVRFGKKLHQFDVGGEITSDEIKLGFKPYIQVILSNERSLPPSTDKSSQYAIAIKMSSYMNSDEFLERQKEVISKLEYLDLELAKVYIETDMPFDPRIIFLIYSK